MKTDTEDMATLFMVLLGIITTAFLFSIVYL